jgi:hypothetical protein
MCQVLYKAQESLNVFKVLGHGPVADASHLISIGVKTSVIDKMAKAIHVK